MVLTTFLLGSLRGAQTGPQLRLNGTFIQLLSQHGSWTPAQWNQLFEWLQSAGIDHLVVQWTVFDDSAFYPSSTWKPVQNAPLETILTLADSHEMRVLVGLVEDSSYWSSIERDSASVSSYLEDLRGRSITAARELTPILRRYRCAEGWYVPGEIDDVNWRSPESRALLLDHLGRLALDLRGLNPGMRIAISGFSQAQSSPDGFREFWDELFQRTTIDMVLFQDGVGAHKLDLREVPIYLDALEKAAKKNGRTVDPVVELFEQVAGPPIDNDVFRAVPAPLDRIRSQIEIAGRYSPEEIIGFSVPEYMTPLGGEAGAKLLSQYRMLFESKLDASSGR